MAVWLVALAGCAYYNYFYNARRSFEEGESQRMEGTDEQRSGRRRSGLSAYEKCIESAGRMLQYYPDSRWEDDALLLLAKAYYHTGKYRSAIGKIDELTAKYPDSEFVREGMLWKGMSLLMVEQPDSATQILSRLFVPDVSADLRAQAYYALGDYYYGEEQWEPALEQFRQVLGSWVDDEWLRGQSWVRVGDCLSHLDRLEESVTLYDEILAAKTSRRLRFEATLERAVVLRELGRCEEALESFESLLKDAAYIKDFPRIELEAARCLMEMGQYDQARERLEKLAEAEKRGELAAEVQYELGSLVWNHWSDLAAARSAFQAVKQADRSSPLCGPADSLSSEIVELSRFYQRIGFLVGQLAAIDSALLRQRVILPDDTIYIDSVEVMLKDELGSQGRRSSRSRDRDRGAVDRRIEEILEASPDTTADTTAVAEADTSAEIDSTTLTHLMEQRSDELLQSRFELADFHLFERSDHDSAAIYLHSLIETELPEETWGRVTASLAYIALAEGDSAAHDTLYRQILDLMPDGEFGNRARQVLGLPPLDEKGDTLSALFDAAEIAWLSGEDPVRARELYLTAADMADSASEARARALMAAAYLSRRLIGEDSLAEVLYASIEEEFKGTDYAKLARKRNRDRLGKGGGAEEAFPGEQFYDQPPGTFDAEGEMFFPETGLSGEWAGIFEIKDVDEPPMLVTSQQMLDNYLRSYYPLDAYDNKISGVVELEFVVGIGGELSEIKVLSVEPEEMGFKEAARQVIRRLRYHPGRHQGQPVSVRMRQELVFDVTGTMDGAGSTGEGSSSSGPSSDGSTW